MKLDYQVTGSGRKALVTAIAGLTGHVVSYLGVPSFAYAVGPFTISKEGIVEGELDEADVQALTNELAQVGFEATGALVSEQQPGQSQTDDRFTLEVPLAGFTEQALENLGKLIQSKAGLIKKAVGAKDLSIIKTEDALQFPWFIETEDPETIEAYAKLIEGLCHAAKEVKRITAKDKPVENEKFAFRVFLVRLGFVGDEYKSARKILLKNLDGNSAFKNGRPEKEAEDE